MSLSTELAGLQHGNERRLELKSVLSNVDRWTRTNVAVVGAENSWRVLSAIASNSDAKLFFA
jgi:hypothetical protein